MDKYFDRLSVFDLFLHDYETDFLQGLPKKIRPNLSFQLPL